MYDKPRVDVYKLMNNPCIHKLLLLYAYAMLSCV